MHYIKSFLLPLYVFDIEYLNIANRIEMTKENPIKELQYPIKLLNYSWISRT